MKLLLAACVLLGAAILASELVRLKQRLPLGFRAILYTYGEFVFLGFALGPRGFDLLSADFLSGMKPFIALGIGLMGLFYGLQFDWKTIKRFSARLFVLTIAQALFTFVFVFSAFILLFVLVNRAQSPLSIELAAALAAIASMTDPTAISILVRENNPRGPNSDLLRFIASVDGIAGLVLFNLVLSWVNPSLIVSIDASHWVNAAAWFGLSLGVGLLSGLLFCALLRRSAPPGEMAVYLSGVTILTSGLSWSCGLSPLFTMLAAGIVLANYSHRSEIVYSALGKLERPAFIVFLVLVGAHWTPKFYFAFLLIPAYIGFRALGKYFGFQMASSAVRLPVKPHRELGLGLLSQGGLALAMTANLTILVREGPFESVLYLIQTVVLISILLNEFVTPGLTRRALRKAGEL
jgi:Kef-type K+ transport system membrane component KefB